MDNFIPSVTTPEHFKTCEVKTLRKIVREYIKDNFLKISPIHNKNLDIDIYITVSSAKKTAFGEAMYYKKASIVLILDQIIENAIFVNFSQPKETERNDNQLIGYLNFKCDCLIDGNLEVIKLAVKFQKGGKFYYNVEVEK